MAKKKRLEQDDEQVIKDIINKQLEIYNVTYDDLELLDNFKVYTNKIIQKIWMKYRISMPAKKIHWTKFYTQTELEYKEWKQWCYNYFRSNIKGYSQLSKKKFNKMFQWIDLDIGLKIK